MASRGSFSNKLGFILAAAGSAVGLGNIWKFPFEVGNGGGAAFVVLYLSFCFILCFPVMITEIAIGRKTSLNPVGAFNALGFKKWNFVGKLGLFCGVLILSFYNVVAGWAFGYFLEMLMGNFEIGQEFGTYIKDIFKVGSYAVIFMFTTAFIVSKGVSGGIEKAAKILMPTLILMILGLVVYAMTLENGMKGISFYLVPDFSEINITVIGGALRQAFFSLSLGMGALITYGSYVGKDDNIVSSAAYITLMDVGIAFIAGLMIFPFVAFNLGGNMQQVTEPGFGGPGLIFVTLPGVFETLGGIWGVIIGSFFFLLLSFAALTSTVSLLEVPVAYVVDEHKVNRTKAVWIVAGFIFLFGIPSLLSGGYSEFFSNFSRIIGVPNEIDADFLSFVAATADVLLLLGGCLIVFFAGYIWKKHNLHEEIAQGYTNYDSSFVKKFLNLSILVLCPVLLAILFIMVLLNNFFGFSII